MSNQETYKFDSLIDDILKKVPGVIGMLLINQNGEILYTNGRFDILPFKLGIVSAICQGCMAEIGHGFNQMMASMIIEYENLKFYHLNIANNGALVI
ncbi:hypothetical protein JW964_16980, partial [candidate division KSB1 bacterium]|nr:hypothetical protein [candidate division KSB1 bacterium]